MIELLIFIVLIAILLLILPWFIDLYENYMDWVSDYLYSKRRKKTDSPEYTYDELDGKPHLPPVKESEE